MTVVLKHILEDSINVLGDVSRDSSLHLGIKGRVHDLGRTLDLFEHRVEVKTEDFVLLLNVHEDIIEVLSFDEHIPKFELENIIFLSHLTSKEFDELEKLLDKKETNKFRGFQGSVVHSIFSNGSKEDVNVTFVEDTIGIALLDTNLSFTD